MPVLFSRKRIEGGEKQERRTMTRLWAVILVAVLAVAGAFALEHMNFSAAGPPASQGGRQTVVLIAPGEHLLAISKQLKADGIIRSSLLFALGVRLRSEGGRLKAGEYAIPSGASMDNVAAILVAGQSIEHKLTAAEGLTSQMIYEIVRNDPDLIGDPGNVPPEGSLLPETYLYTHGMTRTAIIARLMQAQKTFLDKAWQSRAPNLPFRTPADVLILASIVEKETAIPEERRHIAAVFINRLRLGMKLESDPTIIYGITRGYPLGRRIRESEIKAATPYNTYMINGLPATPICNPGKDSIAAVLQPEQSNDLYFVADGTGGHVFTASIAEHQKNVARWRQIESGAAHP
jgi:UPF0755 protein